MNQIQQDVQNRELGQFPVSIGTSLALEAMMGIYPDRPEVPPPYVRTKQLWVNLRTVVRNLIACLPTDLRDRLLPEDLWEVFYEELNVIPAVVTNGTQGKVATVYYVSDYSGVDKKYPGALLKEAKTEKQIFLQKLEEHTLKLALSRNQHLNIQFFQNEIVGQHPASFILTHLPYDLLARYRFDSLELLESHTGKIKGPSEWNTKLSNGKEMPNIPFNSFTIQLFGDNGNMFVPYRPTLRKLFLEFANRYGMTKISSMDKIRDTVGKIPNDVHRAELVKLL